MGYFDDVCQVRFIMEQIVVMCVDFYDENLDWIFQELFMGFVVSIVMEFFSLEEGVELFFDEVLFFWMLVENVIYYIV